MKVLWTPGARRRLQEIEAHIAQDSPQAARQMAERLLRRSQMLSEPPLLGKRLQRYVDDDVRELLERPYRLIYRVTPEAIEILTLLHYRQLLPSDLAGLHGRHDT